MSFEQPLHTIEEKAAEAMAVLGFEALYQADDESTYPSFEEHSNEYRDEIATTSNSTASDFDLNVLFGTSTDEHDITELTLDSGRGRERNSNAEKDASQAEVDVSKGIVAWFHQKRVEKSKPPKMAIIMATEEVTALTPKRKASFSTTDTGSTISSKAPDYTPHLYYHPSSPKKRRSVGNKMRVWLRKRSSAKDHVKTLQADLSPQHVPENEPMPPPRTPPEATQTEGGNTHRLTIVSDKIDNYVIPVTIPKSSFSYPGVNNF